MTSFKRWLVSLGLVLCVATLTMSCQVLFGDFKVGDGAEGGASQIDDGSGARGGSTTDAGADPDPDPDAGAGGRTPGGAGSQSTGPIVVVPTGDLFTSDLGAQARLYVSLAKSRRQASPCRS